ncbi:hypothetical protein FRC01_007428 [Tulasnella sp. 417]|nr:hypothetical protein FRC01_007428 [Tulasnella sp. 417]
MLPHGVSQVLGSSVTEENLASATSALRLQINLQPPPGRRGNSVGQSLPRAGTRSIPVSAIPVQEFRSSIPLETLGSQEGPSSSDTDMVIPPTRSSTSQPDPALSTQVGLQNREFSLLPSRTIFKDLLLRLLTKPQPIVEEVHPDPEASEGAVIRNVPLEITLYLGSYIAEIQRRKIADVPTLTSLFNTLSSLSDSLTGLERILRTPIPPSYKILLWAVIIIFVTLLPFQLWTTFQYWTILVTAIVAFIFFGFLTAGDDIENPFGYDRNHLNLDNLTREITVDLKTLMSHPPPGLEDLALGAHNNEVLGEVDLF